LVNNPPETFLMILQQDFRGLKYGYRLKTAKIFPNDSFSASKGLFSLQKMRWQGLWV
jgi:hypothetical protein